jgi:hypothetical protein
VPQQRRTSARFAVMGRESALSRATLRVAASALAATAALTGCPMTQVLDEQRSLAVSPDAPDRVLVFDFASSPEDVALNRAISARIARVIGASENTRKRALGREMGVLISDALVDGFWKRGIHAEPADERTDLRSGDLVLTGQFLTIDAGNDVARFVIGFGVGASELRTRVQLHRVEGESASLLEEFHTVAESSRRPSVTTAIPGDAGDSVEATGRRTARSILDHVTRFYVGQEWLDRRALE